MIKSSQLDPIRGFALDWIKLRGRLAPRTGSSCEDLKSSPVLRVGFEILHTDNTNSEAVFNKHPFCITYLSVILNREFCFQGYIEKLACRHGQTYQSGIAISNNIRNSY